MGDTSYTLVRPILRKLKADQLIQVETNSPHIATHSQEIWEYYIRRDFQSKGINEINELREKQNEQSTATEPTSQNPDPNQINWRGVYKKMARDRERHLENASNRLRANIEQINKDRDYWKITQLDHDPKAHRAKARRNLNPQAPIGSRLLHKTFQHANDYGPSIFSPRNVRFLNKTPQGFSQNRVIRPPRSTLSSRSTVAPSQPAQPRMMSSILAGMKRDQTSMTPVRMSPSTPVKRQRTEPANMATSQKLFSINTPKSPPNNPIAFHTSPDVRYKRAAPRPPAQTIDKSASTPNPPQQANDTPGDGAGSTAANTESPKVGRKPRRPRKAPSIFITKR